MLSGERVTESVHASDNRLQGISSTKCTNSVLKRLSALALSLSLAQALEQALALPLALALARALALALEHLPRVIVTHC